MIMLPQIWNFFFKLWQHDCRSGCVNKKSNNEARRRSKQTAHNFFLGVISRRIAFGRLKKVFNHFSRPSVPSFYPMPRKGANISKNSRPRRRKQTHTLHESTLGKQGYVAYVGMGQCLSALESACLDPAPRPEIGDRAPTRKRKQRKQFPRGHESTLGKQGYAASGGMGQLSALESACLDHAPRPEIGDRARTRKRKRRRQLSRGLSTFKYPKKKAARAANDLATAVDGVLDGHGISDADLPIIQSAALNLPADTRLAKLIKPPEQEANIPHPSPIAVNPKPDTQILQKLVKLMDTKSISSKKVNEVRQLFPAIPAYHKIRELQKTLDSNIAETLGLYSGPDYAGVDPSKVVRRLLHLGLIPGVRRKYFLISGDGKNTGRKMKSTSLGMQDLTLGKDVAQEKNFFVLFTVRGGEKFEDLNGKLDDLEAQLLSLVCPCSDEAPCEDDCPHCLNVDGHLHCIKFIWASDWKFMQLISGVAQANAPGNWCHWCAATKADIRDGLQSTSWVTDPLRFNSSPASRLMPKLWSNPSQLFLDELHWRLRVYGVILNEIEAKVFHNMEKDAGQAIIKAEMVRCGITHFTWFSRMAPVRTFFGPQFRCCFYIFGGR